MSILVYVELTDGQLKKSSQEAIFYGSKVAEITGASGVQVLVIGKAEVETLATVGQFGAGQVWHVDMLDLHSENIMACADALILAIQKTQSKMIIAAKSSLADAVMARAAAAFSAGMVGNVLDLPLVEGNGVVVKNSIFSGKAFAYTKIHSEVKFLALKKNIISIDTEDIKAQVSSFEVEVSDLAQRSKTIETFKTKGVVPLPEADLVVSGGRGMKGPEHWQPLLDLADALGATTACSKPVSDLEWRPHHEHVGQTGVKVSPNLYIACGISGAIQHLAGVNASKVIVVINKDPEAPFFKAADYGIVGDVFEVLPRLTAAVKKLIS